MSDAKSRSGKSFAAATKNDPVAKAALAQSQLRLAAYGAGAGQVAKTRVAAGALIGRYATLLREAKAAGDAERTQALQTLARELQANRAAWEAAYGEPYPRDLDDWIRQATRAGVDPGAVSSIPPSDVLPVIEGYLLRLRDQAQVSMSADLPRLDRFAKTLEQYKLACEQQEWGDRQLTPKEAYRLLQRMNAEARLKGKPEPFKLPKYQTWRRYLREVMPIVDSDADGRRRRSG